ncbi:DUF6263 family protein [Carboxylicivirga taeanensis]|uniref:DUF6263 family protein n=1 Tax=Carboxylicivirga taeanensis TaxID=1416875 RepID=UPI003F6E0166
MKKQNLFLLLVAAVMISLNASAQTSLRYNLKVGETYMLKQNTTQAIAQNVSGISQNIKTTMGGDIAIKITGKSDKIYSSELVFESMMFKVEMPMMNMSYDSKDATADPNNPLNKTFNLIVGHKFEMQFDERGTVNGIKGFEALLEKVTTAFGDNPQSAEMMKQQLAGQFSDESMKNMMSNILIVFPEEKVTAGSKWTTNTMLSKPLPVNNTFNYNVEAVDGSVVKLSGSGTTVSKEGETVEQNGMIQHFDLKGDVVFAASINAQTGWPTEIKMTQNMDGNVAIESAQLPAPMEVPMNIKAESTFTSM